MNVAVTTPVVWSYLATPPPSEFSLWRYRKYYAQIFRQYCQNCDPAWVAAPLIRGAKHRPFKRAILAQTDLECIFLRPVYALILFFRPRGSNFAAVQPEKTHWCIVDAAAHAAIADGLSTAVVVEYSLAKKWQNDFDAQLAIAVAFQPTALGQSAAASDLI